MKQNNTMKPLQMGALGFLAIGLMLLVGLMMEGQSVHALPEYSSRTDEACGACHVNPGGGGPRTMAGLMWSAQGNPDSLPALTINLAPGVNDGVELYDIGCAGCHGLSGEGLFGSAIVGSGLQARKIETAVLRGRERSGMPAYEGQLTEEQLAALVDYTAGLASGQIEPPPSSYKLPAGVLIGDVIMPTTSRGGN